MIKYLVFSTMGFFLFIACSSPDSSESLVSAESQEHLYDIERDAIAEIDSAIHVANIENKNVLIQVGGNWCPWCIRLHHFIDSHPRLDSIVSADYVLIRVNYSKENKNPDAMKRLEFPNRFGFPVLVVLDGTGKRLHTQYTALLEKGNGYSEENIKRFLLSWNVKAVSPETYQGNE
jgi:thioredoxin-related protein